jgi:hypothetical protein
MASVIVRDIVAIKSYALWSDNQFREFIDFVKITNKQQDKIFNDLQVTALLYLLLFLDERANKNDASSIIYSNIGEYTVDAFIAMMEDAELTGKQIALWRELIKRRESEYRKDLGYVMKESQKWDVFAGEDRLLRDTWGRVATLSLGVLKHIRKAKSSIKDPLWRVIRRWLISLEVELIQVFKDTDMDEIKVLN